MKTLTTSKKAGRRPACICGRSLRLFKTPSRSGLGRGGFLGRRGACHISVSRRLSAVGFGGGRGRPSARPLAHGCSTCGSDPPASLWASTWRYGGSGSRLPPWAIGCNSPGTRGGAVQPPSHSSEHTPACCGGRPLLLPVSSQLTLRVGGRQAIHPLTTPCAAGLFRGLFPSPGGPHLATYLPACISSRSDTLLPPPAVTWFLRCSSGSSSRTARLFVHVLPE